MRGQDGPKKANGDWLVLFVFDKRLEEETVRRVTHRHTDRQTDRQTGGGRDAFKTRTHTSESGGNKRNIFCVFMINRIVLKVLLLI